MGGKDESASLRDWRTETAGTERPSLSPLIQCHVFGSCTHCPDVPCKHLSVHSNITVYRMCGQPGPHMRAHSRACDSGTPASYILSGCTPAPGSPRPQTHHWLCLGYWSRCCSLQGPSTLCVQQGVPHPSLSSRRQLENVSGGGAGLVWVLACFNRF